DTVSALSVHTRVGSPPPHGAPAPGRRTAPQRRALIRSSGLAASGTAGGLRAGRQGPVARRDRRAEHLEGGPGRGPARPGGGDGARGGGTTVGGPFLLVVARSHRPRPGIAAR